MESLFLDFSRHQHPHPGEVSQPQPPEVLRLHPVPMFGILDHHIRRSKDQPRVIGALVGIMTGNTVEITNAFPVNHSENNDEVSLGRPNLEKMVHLNNKIHPNERVVGWYSTTPTLGPDEEPSLQQQSGPAITDFSVAVHNFFTQFIEDYANSNNASGTESTDEVLSPVHLVVDTSLSQPRLTFNAYTTSANPFINKLLVAFNQIKVDVVASEAEKVGLDAMTKGKEIRGEHASSLTTELDGLESAIGNIRKMLSSVLTYVDEVVAKKREPDPTIGRLIADTLAAVPHMDQATFHSLFQSSLQDLLMVTYLSNLTQTQLALAERITTSVKPKPLDRQLLADQQKNRDNRYGKRGDNNRNNDRGGGGRHQNDRRRGGGGGQRGGYRGGASGRGRDL
eukprot:gb/GECG01011249.1/.p1 GENE.gb/GECG01011249.1/~~gb/GECG01011249.1/.p1  ORF type:complete len:395 (+),score=48.35 gb/GECG01011249.1/:1-1185(+)